MNLTEPESDGGRCRHQHGAPGHIRQCERQRIFRKRCMIRQIIETIHCKPEDRTLRSGFGHSFTRLDREEPHRQNHDGVHSDRGDPANLQRLSLEFGEDRPRRSRSRTQPDCIH